MRCKKIFVLVIVILCLLLSFEKYVVANNDLQIYNDDEFIYIETSLKSDLKEKVIIDESCVPIFEEAGVTVNKKTWNEGLFPFIRHYTEYSYETKTFVKKVVNTRKVSDDIDSILYMVRRLEWYADQYDNASNFSKKDLVIGYLRCINPSYRDGYSDGLSRVVEGSIYANICKSYDKDFVDFVNVNEKNKFPSSSNIVTIEKYFSMFLVENGKSLLSFSDVSPAKDITKSSIDLIHLFCVIDVFDKGFSNTELQNVMSWEGDLHQGAQFLKEGKNKSFIKLLDENNSTCSYSDIIADIDGINIALAYLHAHDGGDSNKISDCVAAYYRSIRGTDFNKNESDFRFKLFIKKMSQIYDSIYSESNIAEKEKIKYMICDAMVIKHDYSDYSEVMRNIKLTSTYYYYLRYDGVPDYKIRKNIAVGFFNFIIEGAKYEEI